MTSLPKKPSRFYDHPKVLIFKKTNDFDVNKVAALLGTVDLTNVVRLLPKQAADYKDLLLPDARLVSQRAGGTWSELFNYDWIQNKYPVVGVVIWYALHLSAGTCCLPDHALGVAGASSICVSAQPHCGAGSARVDFVDGRFDRRAVYASHHRRGICHYRCGRLRVMVDPQRPVQSGVEFQPSILRFGRDHLPRLLPDRPADPPRQFGYVASIQRAANGRWTFRISTRF